jgi:hypothetical protein
VRSGSLKADPWLRGILEKACLAVGHSILVIAWHILSTRDETYRELGADWFTRPTTKPRMAYLCRGLG